MRSSLTALLLLLSASAIAGCSADVAPDAAAADEADVTAEATLKLTADFQSKVVGTPTAGKGLRIEYALERLPQCRGNVGGGGPGWNITGYYSENGGAPKTFEVTALSSDGKDRVAKPAIVTPSQGGDLAIWFQVSSRWGCSEYDSQFGQNYHLEVRGTPPGADAAITFGKDGSVKQDGALHGGSKVRVRYEQDRLPACRRTERGNPVWAITGFAQLDREAPRSFDTARPEGAERKEIDAIIEIPHAGTLSLWFQVSSLGGCMQYDSKNGANYVFRVE
ncbi:MAG: hypothetical protein JST00_12450 [Deltaproteobacteria bacterium]|nr:hypothetical protein [Deltaproteobacteria bacterium]